MRIFVEVDWFKSFKLIFNIASDEKRTQCKLIRYRNLCNSILVRQSTSLLLNDLQTCPESTSSLWSIYLVTCWCNVVAMGTRSKQSCHVHARILDRDAIHVYHHLLCGYHSCAAHVLRASWFQLQCRISCSLRLEMSANSRIIRFGFFDHEEYEEKGKRKHRASCKFCKAKSPKLTEFCGTTSNFTRHLQRVHKTK